MAADTGVRETMIALAEDDLGLVRGGKGLKVDSRFCNLSAGRGHQQNQRVNGWKRTKRVRAGGGEDYQGARENVGGDDPAISLTVVVVSQLQTYVIV